MIKKEIAICWFRRDLRLEDHAALYHALKSGYPVLSLFIFDKTILDKLENKNDKRVIFICRQIERLQKELSGLGSSIISFYGKPFEVWSELLNQFNIKAVYVNNDYEPYASDRDEQIRQLLRQHNISFHSCKDQVVFEKDEIVKDDGTPYTIYTPYSKRWMQKLDTFYLKSYPTKKYFKNFLKTKSFPVPELKEMGFENSKVTFPSSEISDELIRNYGEQRNYPGINGTSHIGVHLRFGTISIRKLATKAKKLRFMPCKFNP